MITRLLATEEATSWPDVVAFVALMAFFAVIAWVASR